MKKIIITGDLTINWYIARIRTSEGEGSLGDPRFETGAFRQPGGALLLGSFVKEMAKSLKDKYSILSNELPIQESPTLEGYWHSFTICSEFPKHAKSKETQETAWRIDEFLGSRNQLSTGTTKPESPYALPEDKGAADLIVIDFFGLQDFRNHQSVWPMSLRTAGPAWVLLKWARPTFNRDESFLNALKMNFQDHIIAVLTLNDLRLTNMQISRGLSWERTAQDVIREVCKRKDLANFAHLVISLETEGAIVLSRTADGKWDSKLYYDPRFIEGTWAQDYGGAMFGHTYCLVAGIALQLMCSSGFPKELALGVRSGLSAARKLHRDGFKTHSKPGQALRRLEFPITDLASHMIQRCVSLDGIQKDKVADTFAEGLKIDSNKSPFIEEPILEPSVAVKESAVQWTILAKLDGPDKKRVKVTRELVANGHRILESKVPIGRFHKLVTFDRAEIESLRSISALIREYDYLKVLNRPLSIAVFGSPGSGKSFAIKSVARAVSLAGNIADLEFNLSQFGRPEDLFGALHQVRDLSLSGKLPLVFWDEFDTTFESRPLGWLQYFLAPMQDAKFHEGQITHFIGRAIFVFAGGTSATMEEFTKKATEDKGQLAKGPDFLSRLRGYVDIPSLDHPMVNGQYKSDFGIEVRRAILLRSFLLRFAPDLVTKSEGAEHIGIYWGVRQAFLKVPTYKYGARSMEAIVQMSQLKGKSHFEFSSLAPLEQLKLHVDADKFVELANWMGPEQ
jgi:hypothetical protein